MKKQKMIKENKGIYGTICVCIIILFVYMMKIHNNEIWRLLGDTVLIIGLVYCVIQLFIAWMSYIVWERCRFVPYLKLLKFLKKFKVNNENVNIHFALLKTYIILGMYSEAEKEIREVDNLRDHLSKMQKIELKIYELNYLRATEQEGFENEIQESLQLLQETELKSVEIGESFQRVIYLHQYMNQQDWNAVINILQEFHENTVYEQVEKAYWLGMCYLKTGKYNQAIEELAFVKKYGGDTKYVFLATEKMKDVPLKDITCEKKTEKNNKQKLHLIKYSALSILCFVGLVYINLLPCKVVGNTIVEAYSENYNVNVEDVEILYQEELGKSELAILEDQKYITYMLSERNITEGKSNYKISRVYRVSKNELVPDISKSTTKIAEMAGDAEFNSKATASQEVYQVIDQFYKKEDIFYTDTFSCIGISYYANVEDIEIEGERVDIIKTITISGENAYIWKVDHIDLENVNYLDFSFE